MVILGIDPGTATTGFGIIRVVGNSFKTVDYGVITTPPGIPMEQRLVMIYEQMNKIIDTWKPDQVAIEELYFNQNVTTGITVGQARGVLLLSCAQKGLPVFEYTPLQVKQAIVGNGRAEKKQVQFMVKTFLGPMSTLAPFLLSFLFCKLSQYPSRKEKKCCNFQPLVVQ